ncbi:MAG: hypothetical protein ACP5NW_00295 [Candidatus Woesearchaeota archaeon]
MIIYVLVLILSFLGIIIGLILSNMTVEEIDYAKKYLKYLNLIILPIIMFISTYNINKIYSIIFSIMALTLLVIFRKKSNDAWIYPSMSVALYLSSVGTRNQLLTSTILIFIYGMSISSIDASGHFKNKINGKIRFQENISLLKKLLANYGLYLIVGIISYVMFTYVL